MRAAAARDRARGSGVAGWLRPASACRVPSSSANLGPGFECSPRRCQPAIEVRGERGGAVRRRLHRLPFPRDRTNLVVRAFERLHPADGLHFSITSTIPLSGGLGSSAAAIVAGLLAAATYAGVEPDLLALASELEGHPDNAAASLYGGVVICADEAAHRLDPPRGLTALLVVPHEGVTTALARAALPAQVEMADAVFNTAHGALLVARADDGQSGTGRGWACRSAPRAPSSASLSALGGTGRTGARAWRTRRHDFGRRADRAGVERAGSIRRSPEGAARGGRWLGRRTGHRVCRSWRQRGRTVGGATRRR